MHLPPGALEDKADDPGELETSLLLKLASENMQGSFEGQQGRAVLLKTVGICRRDSSSKNWIVSLNTIARGPMSLQG